MSSLPEKTINSKHVVVALSRYFRKVAKSNKAFLHVLKHFKAVQFVNSASDLRFSPRDIILLLKDRKGVMVWKYDTPNKFSCYIFFSKSERPLSQLIQDSTACVLALHPHTTLTVELGSGLIVAASSKPFEISGWVKVENNSSTISLEYKNR